MKKIFVIAFTIFAASSSFGQKTAQEATEMTNKLVTDLGLTAEQTQRVSEIYQNAAAKNEAVAKETGNSEQYKNDVLARTEAACKAQINEVLTAEQRTKFEQTQNKRTEPVRTGTIQRKNVPMSTEKTPAKPAN